MDMISLDFAPLFRSTVGFDRPFDLPESGVWADWPPYNIEMKSENDYRITMAVAGFGPENIEIMQHGGVLTVKGEKVPDKSEGQLLHEGLISNFKREFKLAAHVKVAAANLDNGLLYIDLVREIPEELKPRRIEINGSVGSRDGGNERIRVDSRSKAKVA